MKFGKCMYDELQFNDIAIYAGLPTDGIVWCEILMPVWNIHSDIRENIKNALY